MPCLEKQSAMRKITLIDLPNEALALIIEYLAGAFEFTTLTRLKCVSKRFYALTGFVMQTLNESLTGLIPEGREFKSPETRAIIYESFILTLHNYYICPVETEVVEGKKDICRLKIVSKRAAGQSWLARSVAGLKSDIPNFRNVTDLEVVFGYKERFDFTWIKHVFPEHTNSVKLTGINSSIDFSLVETDDEYAMKNLYELHVKVSRRLDEKIMCGLFKALLHPPNLMVYTKGRDLDPVNLTKALLPADDNLSVIYLANSWECLYRDMLTGFRVFGQIYRVVS